MLRILLVFFASTVVHCERRFNVVPGGTLCNNSTWRSSGSLPVGSTASCSGFSELLRVISSNIAAGDSVMIDVEGGNDYYLDESIYFVFPNISIAIKGVNLSISDKPRIICAQNRTLTNTLYALRFNRSNSVVLDGLEFVGCPRPISIIDTLNLTITNSLFRCVTCL